MNLPLFKYLYNKYKDGFIPFLGKHVANKEYAYKYLAESINKFPNQKIIEKELRNIGYYQVSIINLFFGIVVIYKGWKLLWNYFIARNKIGADFNKYLP